MKIFNFFNFFNCYKQIVALLLCGSLCNFVFADVFVRTTRAAAVLAGGTTVYSAEAEVNGLPVTLAVNLYYGASGRTVSGALTQTSGSKHIVIPSPTGPATIVITIDGTTRGGAPTTAGLPDIPDFTPGFSAFNHDTKTRTAVGSSPFAPESAMRSAAAALARQGWVGATPGTTAPTSGHPSIGGNYLSPSCAFFTKGNATALVGATPRADGTSSLIIMVKN